MLTGGVMEADWGVEQGTELKQLAAKAFLGSSWASIATAATLNTLTL